MKQLTLGLLVSMLASFAAGYYFGPKTGEVNRYQNGLNNYAGQDIYVGGKLVYSLPECRNVCAVECPPEKAKP